MEIIINYLPLIIVLLILIGGAIAFLCNEKKSAKEWLLLAVTEAEKALGGGVGALKLRAAFQEFVKTFPALAKVVTFERFSKWVDVALGQMKQMLKNNDKVAKYVGTSQEKERETANE